MPIKELDGKKFAVIDPITVRFEGKEEGEGVGLKIRGYIDEVLPRVCERLGLKVSEYRLTRYASMTFDIEKNKILLHGRDRQGNLLSPEKSLEQFKGFDV